VTPIPPQSWRPMYLCISASHPPEQNSMILNGSEMTMREHHHTIGHQHAGRPTDHYQKRNARSWKPIWNAVFNSEVTKGGYQDMKRETSSAGRSVRWARRTKQLQIGFTGLRQHEGAQRYCWPRPTACCGVSSSARLGLQRRCMDTLEHPGAMTKQRQKTALGYQESGFDGRLLANPVGLLTQNRKTR